MTEAGSVTLPAELRKRLGLKGGQQFEAVARGNVVLLVPVVVTADALRGTARGARTDDYRDDER
jgi:AbrB family looped-hinge helix DNA binding protein